MLSYVPISPASVRQRRIDRAKTRSIQKVTLCYILQQGQRNDFERLQSTRHIYDRGFSHNSALFVNCVLVRCAAPQTPRIDI